MNEDEKEFFEERAAILEFDANLKRDLAEIRARLMTRDYKERKDARDND